MADGENVPGEPGKDTHYSEPALFADKPPRLIVAINRLQLEPNRTLPDADPGAAVPNKDAVTDAEGATYVGNMLQVIADGLTQGSLDDAWKTDAGREDAFSPGDPEVAWSRRIAELFTGSSYGGPDVSADFIRFGDGDPPKETRKRAMPPIAYIYQRFQRTYAKREDYCTSKALSETSRETNTDPAYSLFIACQHLSTYMLLARGFNIEDDFLGVGLAAGSNPQIPLFSEARGGKWVTFKDATHGEKPLETKYAIGELGLSPGSVYCYDPYGAINGRKFWLIPSDFEYDEEGHLLYDEDKNTHEKVPRVSAKRRTELWQSDAAFAKDFKGDRDAPDAPQFAGKKVVEDYQRAAGVDSPDARTPVFLRKIQADGSHIFGILRIESSTGCEDPGGTRAQAFDTSGSKWISQSESVHLPDDPKVSVKAVSPTTGMFEGDWSKTIYRGNHYVGLGIPPEAPDLAEMPDWLAKARPVGVARLVVTRRVNTFNRPDVSDILYVSKYIRTYGDGETDNYSIARFLLSMRNVPYYRDLQAFWFLYAPRGKLAELMWAEGARSRSLSEMFAEVLAFHKESNDKSGPKATKRPTNQLRLLWELFCASVVSYDSYGLAQVQWRNRTAGADGSVPRVLKQYFVDGGPLNITTDGKLAKLGIPWDGEYVHPKIVEAGGSVEVPDLLKPPDAPAPDGGSTDGGSP